MKFFLIQKSDFGIAENLIGKAQSESIESRSIYSAKRKFHLENLFQLCISIFTNPHGVFRFLVLSGEHAPGFIERGKQIYLYHRLFREKFELVYFNSLQLAPKFFIDGFFPGSKILGSSRGQDFDFKPGYYRNTLDKISGLHVISDYLGKKAQLEGFERKHIHKIFPAVGEERKPIKTPSTTNNKIIITTAARLTWVKGHEFALRAIKELIKLLPSVEVQYRIIGDGVEKEFLSMEVNRLGLSKTVQLVGWKNLDETLMEIASSDIYFLFSISEGFNNSVLHAQNLGIPCVVSDTGGLPENIEDTVSGFVVPRYDWTKAAESLANLARSKDLRKQFGSAGRQRVDNWFTIDDQIKHFDAFFRSYL